MPLLQPSINFGLNEFDFWNMTPGEIERWLNGATWRYKIKAQMDYSLANLIGLSNSRLLSKDAKFPGIEEVYPNLFEEDKQNKEVREEMERIKKSQQNFITMALKINKEFKNNDGRTEN